MDEPVRILQVFMDLGRSGVPEFLMNYHRNINIKRVQFDYAVETAEDNYHDKEIYALGGRVFKLDAGRNTLEYYIKLQKVIRKGNYSIVHSHMNYRNLPILFTAFLAGARVRISHSHSTYRADNLMKEIIRRMIMFLNKLFSTHLFACSEEAGICLYGRKCRFRVINNAIDLEKFSFKPEIREEIRNELGAKDKYIIGNVGNFLPLKNHAFMIEVFSEFSKMRPDSLLLLAGSGPLIEKTKKTARSLGIEKSIIFMGKRDDVHRLNQAFDLFLQTSIHEGLGIVLIEAQASGLRCIASDVITRESNPSGLCTYLPLDKGACYWAERMAELSKDIYDRKTMAEKLSKNGFSIKEESKKLEQIYYDMKGRHGKR